MRWYCLSGKESGLPMASDPRLNPYIVRCRTPHLQYSAATLRLYEYHRVFAEAVLPSSSETNAPLPIPSAHSASRHCRQHHINSFPTIFRHTTTGHRTHPDRIVVVRDAYGQRRPTATATPVSNWSTRSGARASSLGVWASCNSAAFGHPEDVVFK